MKKLATLLLTMLMVFSCFACGSKQDVKQTADTSQESPKETTESAESAEDLNGQTLLIYCGAGMQKPFEEIANKFHEETGCEMNVVYTNAGQIQAQISESKEGDFFIAGSAEEVKPVSDFVADSVNLVKHIPVLAVASGNPKGITGIADLSKEGIVTVIGDPESTPIGKIAMKVFSDFGVKEKVNLGATTTTAPQLATVVGMGEADAAIIWKENCNAEGVELCETTDMDAYVKVVPSARLNFNKESKAADAFSSFLLGEEANAIWESYGYELAK